MKRGLFFGIFVVFFILLGSHALTQETQKTNENNLTPRQILLLMVPDGWGIEFDNMRWSVVIENGQPKEEIIYVLPDAMDIITIGAENKVEKFVRVVILQSQTGAVTLTPTVSGQLENGVLTARDVMAELLGVASMPIETLQQICDEIVAEAKNTLTALGIETDEKLAELIKKSVTGKKAAVAL